MKILLVNKFHYIKGGSETFYFSLADALEKMGHQVIYFLMKDENNRLCRQNKYFISHVQKDGTVCEKIKFVMNVKYNVEAYKKMTLLLADEEPDLVVLNLIHKQISLSVIDAIKDFKKKRIPIFWVMHELSCVCPAYTMLNGKGQVCEKCLHGDFKNCVKYKCLHESRFMSYLAYKEAKYNKSRQVYDLVDLYICPSIFYKNKLTEAHFTKSKIIYLSNLLSIDYKYEKSNGVKDYLLYLGRLSKEKGIFTLIDAIKTTKKHLIILGTGPLESELKSYVKNLGLETNIEFLGFKKGKELENYVKEAKAVILPSEWYENCPYSAMEALAKGKPLIVSNLGGLPEFVDDGKNGFIFLAGDSDSLVSKINDLFKLSAFEYSEFENYSLNKAKQTFLAENYVQKIIGYAKDF